VGVVTDWHGYPSLDENGTKEQVNIVVAVLFAELYQEAAIASYVKTYLNNKHGFEITYLINWEQSQNPGNPAFLIKRKSETELGAISIYVGGILATKIALCVK